MDVFLLGVVSAFLFFAVLLPLIGVVLGLFCYYVLPYVFGGLFLLALLLVVGVKILLTWWVWIVALLWASAVFIVKLKFRKLGEEIEHYRAAHVVLLCGVPYRRKRDQLRKAIAGDCC
ncbi:MAG: hypothetical protein L3J79_02410 [Candidatus Marinimicrobia bacterium]|nr:hypothetical protein [Candidatus Neomarinimicrobiota bacterium]